VPTKLFYEDAKVYLDDLIEKIDKLNAQFEPKKEQIKLDALSLLKKQQVNRK